MCSFNAVKYLLFVFNFIFWLSGAAIVGLAIYVRVDESVGNAIAFAGVNFYTGSDILLVTGGVMLVVGFSGCCGAIKENACLLGLYFTCLLLIFGVEVGVGVWAFVNFSSIEEAITETVGKIDTADKSFQINVQQTFKCCGTNATCSSFAGNEPVNCECISSTADSTCDTIGNLMGCSGTASQLIYTQSCATALSKFINDNITLIGGVALGIGLAEILGMMISLWLCCKTRDKDRRH